MEKKFISLNTNIINNNKKKNVVFRNEFVPKAIKKMIYI